MLKGSVIITHMLLFLGSLILAVGLMFSLLYLGVSILTRSEIYDAKMMSEMLTGAISALSSTSLNGTIVFKLPAGNCTVNITEDKTNVTIPAGILVLEEKTAEVVKEQSSILNNKRPDYIKINSIETECDLRRPKLFAIHKEGDEIKFEVA